LKRHVATAKNPIDQVRALEANNFQFFGSVILRRLPKKLTAAFWVYDHSEMFTII